MDNHEGEISTDKHGNNECGAGHSNGTGMDNKFSESVLDLLQPRRAGALGSRVATTTGLIGGKLKESFIYRSFLRAAAMIFRNSRTGVFALFMMCLVSLTFLMTLSFVYSGSGSDSDAYGTHGGFRDRMDLVNVEVTRNIRNTTVNALCAVEELNHISLLSSEQRRTINAQILVDDAHKFMYCFVPKVACSNWKRVIKYMNGKVADLETPMKMDHHKDLVFLGDFSDEEAEYRMRNYFKFMFVRDPTERLLSAYRNKFGENIGTYNDKYAPKIIAKYRKAGERIAGDDQSRITFEEFLRFLVDSDSRRMDPHWRPMWELCQPCSMKYDFIGSFEQLSEDATLVLDRVRGESDAYFPQRQSWYKPTTDDKIAAELNKVDTRYMKQVVDKYARDYMLFGYPPPVSEVTRPKNL